MFIPRLPVRTSPPWEGLGEAAWGGRLGVLPSSSFYCSRRDAADGMPVMALVLIFVSPHSLLGVRVFDVLLLLFKEVYITAYSQKNILHNHKDYEECPF